MFDLSKAFPYPEMKMDKLRIDDGDAMISNIRIAVGNPDMRNNLLTENPDVRINIVGHTDSDGADDANLDLSKRRSASVKNELVKTFGIDAARIETDGKGESVPVASNNSPANKALNRRVEFIKL